MWYASLAGSHIARIDPKTGRATVIEPSTTVFALPSRGARVRQILGRPGEVWLPESGADKLAVIRDPKP